MNIKDKKIVDILKNKPVDFWDFKDNFQKEHIHAIANYPASMVPKMQKVILDIFCDVGEIDSIYDPFMGSGTILVLGMEKGLDIGGSDINPYAYLITQVKTGTYSLDCLSKHFNSIKTRWNKNNSFNIIRFNNIDKWYKEEIKIQLSKLLSAIEAEAMEDNYRAVFNLIFGEIVQKASNARNSTSKLHIKKSEEIDKFQFNCITQFEKHFYHFVSSYFEFNSIIHEYLDSDNLLYKKNIDIYLADSVNLMANSTKLNKKYSLIMTSPPYGDNHTTIAYGQYSCLPLNWLHHNKPIPEITNYSTIDRLSLGGKKEQYLSLVDTGILKFSTTLNELNNELIKSKKIDKAIKVLSFYNDFGKFFGNISNFLADRGYAVFTTGNRVVNGLKVEFDKILAEMAINNDFDVLFTVSRNILNKRYPSKVYDKDKKIKSINEENITILKKK